jgi:hypothetical protein
MRERARRYGVDMLHHEVDGWDMHDHGDEIMKPQADRSAQGAPVVGVVVCHHPYGLGIYIADRDEYAHVNITSIKPPGERIDGMADYPPLGSRVEGTVLGYTGIHEQLRVSLVPLGQEPLTTGQ